MTSAASNPVNLGSSPEASPAPSSSTPSKRRRLSDSNEDREARKEARAAARAQRNRLAAQESRDRRKREFAELHSRVAQLEAENAALRESKSGTVFGNERTERLERENAELLESRTQYDLWDIPSRTGDTGAVRRFHSPPSTGGDRPFSFIGCQGDAPAAGGLFSDDLLFTAALPNSSNGDFADTSSSSLSPSTDDITGMDADFWLHAFDQTEDPKGTSWEAELGTPTATADLDALLGADRPTDPTASPSAPVEASTATEVATSLNLLLSSLDGQALEDQLMGIFNDTVDEFGFPSDEPPMGGAEVATPAWPWMSIETAAPSSVAIF
ncbi:hypothetical protein BS47DRAFT_1360489 [Hydnum rufescens UP504]|uniref:BZIP domain-containing protein n=1 Tax=Hydnum rufescens UP504 TaxID=1448309 RepID=A0A9P6B2B8_9AGAM|nr:hypothetical protein BS47DRAFT_1360489 [Hydnum rufescens UP504]